MVSLTHWYGFVVGGEGRVHRCDFKSGAGVDVAIGLVRTENVHAGAVAGELSGDDAHLAAGLGEAVLRKEVFG